MKALAAYVMRGRLQAMLAATGLAIVSLMLIPISWPASFISGAIIALVVLVQGPKEGVFAALGSSAILAVVAMLVVKLPTMALVYTTMVWLPAWLLATSLLLSQSLALALKVGALLGIGIILAVYALITDPAGLWYEHISQQVIPLLKEIGSAVPGDADVKAATRIMTGTTVAFSMVAIWLSLLIARSWQAVLYRPEGFSEEFRSLKFGQQAALFVALVAVLATFTQGVLNELAMNALVVLMMLFVFQGLAVGHNLIYQHKRNRAWLVGMYVLLVFTSLQGLMMFALLGWLDNGFDFRKRFARKDDSKPQDDD